MATSKSKATAAPTKPTSATTIKPTTTSTVTSVKKGK